MPHDTLRLQNLGPIVDANPSFGDLTVPTGPQASGKSTALQMLKLVVDLNVVRRTMIGKGRPPAQSDGSILSSVIALSSTSPAWIRALTRTPRPVGAG